MVRRRGFLRTWVWVVTAALVWSALSPAVYALPVGGSLLYGYVDLLSNPAVLKQHTERAIVSWHDFSIDWNESLEIVQPSQTSILLNLVDGGVMSILDGSLKANGTVLLLNPQGILITNDARIDVGSLVAAAMKLTYRDQNDLIQQFDAFADGRAPLRLTGAGGFVNGAGEVRVADGGYAALLGDSVINFAKISANGGTIVLGAGSGFLLSVDPNGTVSLTPTTSAGKGELITGPLSEIEAPGGVVLMRASGTSGILNLGGIVDASSMDKRDGRILLHADGGVYVGGDGLNLEDANARLRAGTVEIQTGGSVRVGVDSLSPWEDGLGGVEAGELWINAGRDVTLTATAQLLVGGSESSTRSASGSSVGMGAAPEQEAGGGSGVGSSIRANAVSTRPLVVKGQSITLRGQVQVAAGEQPVSVELHAPRVIIDKGQGIAVPGDRSILLIRNPSSLVPSEVVIGAKAALAASTVVIDGNGGSARIEGTLRTREAHLAGTWDSVEIAEVDSFAGRPLVRFMGENAGTPLRVGALTMQASTDLSVSGRVVATGEVRIVAQRDLVLQDPVEGGVTVFTAPRTVLAAGQAFKNHTRYGSDPFQDSGNVLIFSGTDTHGYNPGSLDFPEVYGVAYDPQALPEPEERTIYIARSAPAPEIVVAAPVLEKVFDNTPVVPDPAAYSDLYVVMDGGELLFRMEPFTDGGIEGGIEGSDAEVNAGVNPGIDAGEYTIVPYGASSSSHRLKFLPGRLTITPRVLFPGEIWTIHFAERYYGDSNPLFNLEFFEQLPQPNLAPGHTAEDVGIVVTTPADERSPVGSYPVLITARPGSTQARNYVFPAHPVAVLNVLKRPVYVEFENVVLKEYETLPSTLKFRLHNAPSFVSERDFAPYIVPYTAPIKGMGYYRIEFETRGGEEFLANYDLQRFDDYGSPLPRGWAIVGMPNLDYYIEESWKDGSWRSPGSGSGGCVQTFSPQVQSAQPAAPAAAPGSVVAGRLEVSCSGPLTLISNNPPEVMGLSSHSWPVLGKAMGEMLRTQGVLSEQSFLELLAKLYRGEADAVAAVLPYLFAELRSILEKDEADLTEAERAFAGELARYIRNQRVAAAQQAMREYEQWRSEHYERVTAGCPLCVLYYLEPAPPDHFLEQARTGVSVSPSLEERWANVMIALESSIAAGLGAGAATYAIAATGALNSVASIIFPFAGRAAATAGAAAGVLPGATSLAGPVGLIAAALVGAGLAIDTVVKAEQYREAMLEAYENAQAEVTFADLKALMSGSPELLFMYLSLKTVDPAWRVNIL